MPTLAELKKLKKKKKKKVKKAAPGGRGGGGGGVSELRPSQVPKRPPCVTQCPAGNNVRSWLTAVQHTELMGRTFEDSYALAWHEISKTSPFPGTCGRVCPHPCESACNRAQKEDGAVSINAFERWVGDYGIEHELDHVKLTDETVDKKVAVIGSGPAGISCAHQLARRGIAVTVFEAFPKTGGMLRYGIPPYRLPREVLDAEIDAVARMGVDIQCNTAIGVDKSLDDVKAEYDAVFIGIGAHEGYKLRVEGEDSSNVYSGVGFLHRVNSGEAPDIGDHAVIIGGGNSAIDAARVAKRLGAKTTLLYRRTREEMPAIAHEIDEAIAEDIDLQYLSAPIGIKVEDGRAVAVQCQRMELGEPDSSGRRRPVPIEGSEYEVPCTALIPAISQQPDFKDAERYITGRDWLKPNDEWALEEGVYAGGDVVNLDLVTTAIGHGRHAAERIACFLTGERYIQSEMETLPPISHEAMRLDHYEALERNDRAWVPMDERFGADALTHEVDLGITEDQFKAEAKRCMSCGQCFWCEKCWMYCQSNCIVKGEAGEVYTLKLGTCDGCKKCGEECPCGYLDLS